jgi:hypothetical protein
MANEGRKVLEKRVQRALLQQSFFSWESAVVISLSVLLAVFDALGGGAQGLIPFIPTWAWLAGGLVGEAALIYSSLKDPEYGRRVVAGLLQHEFQPERLEDKRLREQINEALDYRSRITAAIRERRDTALRENLSQTATQIDEWLESIYSLAQRLDRYQKERPILERDRNRARSRIQGLQGELNQEDDEAVRQQIQTNMESLRRQIETINNLDNTMDRARLQMENTLSALGTIYSQTMLVGAKDIDSGRAKRLRQDISEEVHELDDVLAAMDEVYARESSA